MDRNDRADSDVTIVGAGVVGAATALELSRRGAAVTVLEAEPQPALQASGTNSGILHTGFDSTPGALETELILRAAELRDPVLERLGVPVLRCGAELRPASSGEREAVEALAANARANGVEATLREDGTLTVPGEAVTDPVAFTLALLAAAERHGAQLRTGFAVSEIEPEPDRLLIGDGADALAARVVVNCAGLGAGAVARLAGDDSFEVYPRKGEFLVFEQPDARLERILLPVPTERTKGVLVFPTLDGKVAAGPTAVDQEDPDDWSVRPAAREELAAKASAVYPPLAGAEPVFAYAGLRPAGRGSNYVIGASAAEPRLINAAAIRSTGLTASLAIGERVATLIEEAGLRLEPVRELERGAAPPAGAWWRRTAEHRSLLEESPR